MKKVLIVGSGGQGGPCASILAQDSDISEIVLGDIDVDLTNKVKKKINSDKITTLRLDARKVKDIEQAAEGVDVIINLTLLQFNFNIMKAALKAGTHYVDAATGEPIWTQIQEDEPLELNDEFQEASLTALIGCGGTPGVPNVLARYVSDQMERVDEIHIKCGFKPLEKRDQMVTTWDPGWSPETALTDYALEPLVFVKGEYKHYQPFSGCEEYNFPDPVGPVSVCHHFHDEVGTLPRFINKGLKNVDFKYPVDHIAGSLIKMGFASSEPIKVKGVEIVPRDVLMKLVSPPVNSFLKEDESIAKSPLQRADSIVMEIKGVKSGKDVLYKLSWPYSLFTTSEEKLEIFKKFGTTHVAVALPAIVGAKMCVEGDADQGVIFPELLDPIKFLKIMSSMGVSLKVKEVLSRQLSIS